MSGTSRPTRLVKLLREGSRDITGVLRFHEGKWEYQRVLGGPWVDYAGSFYCKAEPDEYDPDYDGYLW